MRFQAQDQAEAEDWIRSLTEHIHQSKGYQNNYLTPITHKFWLQEQISEYQFLEIAETFDILLFKTNRTISEGVRMITNSEFDHAAMVLKFADQPT